MKTKSTTTKPVRSFTARDMRNKAKVIPHRNDRRSKDARKHFTREEW